MKVYLQATELTRRVGDKTLFQGISLGMGEGQRVGLIAQNGTGKTTLLNILAGVDEAEAGTIITGNGVRIGYLPQNPDFDGNKTIIEQAMAGVSPAEQEAKEFQVKNIL